MMDQKLKWQVQDFERQLDAALDALPTRGWSGTSTLRLASELHEIGALKKGIDELGYIERLFHTREQLRLGRGWRRGGRRE